MRRALILLGLLAGPALAHDPTDAPDPAPAAAASLATPLTASSVTHTHEHTHAAPAAVPDTAPDPTPAPPVLPAELAAANNPFTCKDLWEEIGLPVTHKDPEALLLNAPSGLLSPTILCHEKFIAQYNSYTKTPDWVIERLNRETTQGDNRRPSTSFKPDENLPDGVETAENSDYTHSGLARGHNAASADFKASEAWMRDTFWFSNAVPQVQNGFNGGTWKELEEHVQDLAKSLGDGDSIYVITGPVDLPRDGDDILVPADQNACNQEIRLAGVSRLQDHKVALCDATDANPTATCDHGVAVPSGLFKIIYEPRMGRAFGFMMSNEDHRKLRAKGVSHTQYFEKWRASLDVIEEATNINFFPDKPLRWRNINETSCPETRWRQ